VNPELQKYYEDRFDLFSRQGWADLMEDVDTMLIQLNNVSTIADEKRLQFRKGEISILIWLKTLKSVSEKAYEDLNEKNE
jgi:Fe-S cluster biosynthesis and repair protein YggX